MFNVALRMSALTARQAVLVLQTAVTENRGIAAKACRAVGLRRAQFESLGEGGRSKKRKKAAENARSEIVVQKMSETHMKALRPMVIGNSFVAG
jgi:hypothetical protein